MIENAIRPLYQRCLVDPLARRLQGVPFCQPYQITLLAVLCGIFSAVMIAFDEKTLAVTFLLLSGYFDTLDGTLARLQKLSSSKGAVLDIVADRIVEFAVILGLFAVAPQPRAWPALWMLGSSFLCVTSFLVVGIFLANTSQKSFHYSVGLMERAEAFLFFMVMIVFPNWFVVLAWVYTGLVFLTAAIRVYQFFNYP